MSSILDLVRQETDHDQVQSNEKEAGAKYCSDSTCLRNWRIGFAVILFVEGLIFGYFSLILKRFACISTKRFRKLLSFVNIGGGGVFLATGFLHIIPEALAFLAPKEEGHAEEGHGDSHEGHNHGGFPIGPAVILATFLVFMLFEMFLFPHSHSVEDEKVHHHHEQDEFHVEESGEMVDDSMTVENGKKNGLTSKPFMAMLLMTIGIAVHAILESVALGGSSRFSPMLNLFLAIFAHRWATCMALGARYARCELTALTFGLLVVGYSAISPLGIAIGSGVKNASDTVIGVVFAVSGGIFLYVGGFETPVEELVGHKESKLAKFGVYVAGAVVMGIITAILSATGVH